MAEPEIAIRTAAVDQYAGAVLAVTHLIELGHRDILHLAGPPDWFDARTRAKGWRATLEDAGLRAVPPVIGDWSSDFGYAYGLGHELGQATAIFAANDQMALGLVRGLADRGLRVPGDISVVGFDDLPDAKHYCPPLTTVRQDFAALGSLALASTIAAIDGAQGPEHAMIAPTLIVRASTGPPRA
jgi:DNA-binding LacI/PurR family transcriptional regulator